MFVVSLVKFRSNHLLSIIFLLLVTNAVCAAVTVPANPQHAWLAPGASKSLLLAINGEAGHALVVGERGHILQSAGHDAWQQINVPTQVLLTAIYMLDAQYGWAVGHDAVILKTVDGGTNWQQVHENIPLEQPLFDVIFSSRENGIAIGAYGYYLSSSDGGSTWQDKLIHEEHDFHLNAISRNSSGELFIAAEAGQIYRSIDNGDNWSVLPSPYEGSFFDVLSWGESQLAVAGLRGNFYLSNDKGDNWKKIPTNLETSLNSLIQLKNGQILAVGHAGIVLLLSADFLHTTSYQLANRKALSDVYEFKPNQLMLVGESGITTLDLCDVFKSQLDGCP